MHEFVQQFSFTVSNYYIVLIKALEIALKMTKKQVSKYLETYAI